MTRVLGIIDGTGPTAPTYADVPILNTAQIHVDAALDWLLG